MKLTARSAALSSITFAGLLLLSACGKNDQAANQPAASSTAAAPASTAAAPATPAAASTAPARAATTAAAPVAAPAVASTAAAAPAPVAAPVAANATGFAVSGVTLGNAVSPDHKVRKELTSFAPTDKTLYASVDTTGSTEGATLNAKWSYLDNGTTVSNISQSITTDSPATTTFRVMNPNLWPEGKYKVDISVDGKQVSSKTFDVKKR